MLIIMRESADTNHLRWVENIARSSHSSANTGLCRRSPCFSPCRLLFSYHSCSFSCLGDQHAERGPKSRPSPAFLSGTSRRAALTLAAAKHILSQDRRMRTSSNAKTSLHQTVRRVSAYNRSPQQTRAPFALALDESHTCSPDAGHISLLTLFCDRS